MAAKRPLRVLFNDSHANLPSSTVIPQGGPSRFSHLFTTHFANHFKDTELISLLFSHNDIDSRIYLRETRRSRTYLEVVYKNTSLSESYSKTFSKRTYIEFLAPWLTVVGEALDRVQPDVVFLNGFSLTNWMILSEASRRRIPICIQHAGIWKKEIHVAKHRFSPSIRRIFTGFEKETIQKASCQIFLNEFSRDAFFSAHHTKLTTTVRTRTTVIPLPIEDASAIPMCIPQKQTYAIGMVARWDSIKNHHAFLRFGKYSKRTRAPFSLHAVTKWAPTPATTIKRVYPHMVNVIPPMTPAKLRTFYASVDAVLIPSRFDVSPTVLMEAVLCGKPVIISHSVGWISEYAHSALSELVIHPHASGAKIATTLSRLFQKKNAYLPAFRTLQKKILREHTPESVFTRYHRLFTHLTTSYASQ